MSLKRGLLSVLLCVTALVAPLVIGAGNAGAVVPGVNGKLLFTRQICESDTDPCWEIVVANATDTHETVVAGPYPRGVFDEKFIANWSPDGRNVIFQADSAIWQVNANGSGFHQVFAAPAGTFIDDGPAFTPDGRWIIFTRCCPRPSGQGLWRVHPDGTGLRIVTTETVGPKVDGPSDNLAQVSPDGRTIAFQRNANEVERIATVNFAGGRLRELTPGTLAEGVPNWSPDGRRIVFQGFRAFGVVDVWAVNPDGTGLTQVTNDGVSLNPSYSPDGTKIIFSRIMQDGSRDLFTMNPDGTGATQLTHTPVSDRFPQWAPAA